MLENQTPPNFVKLLYTRHKFQFDQSNMKVVSADPNQEPEQNRTALKQQSLGHCTDFLSQFYSERDGAFAPYEVTC